MMSRFTHLFQAAAVPNPGREAPAALTEKVDLVLGIVAWAGTAAGVAGVLVVGAMMAISVKRGESSEHMSRLGMVLGGCVLVSTAGPLINFVFT
jgi:ribose/xylose/arabinose/galactoside ABC-type transport system permease subunit